MVGGLTAASTHFLADCVCSWKMPSLNSPGDAHGWRDRPNSTRHGPRNWTGKFCREVRSAGDLSPKRGCLHGWCYLCGDVAQNTLLTTLLCNLTTRGRASDERQVGVREACHRILNKAAVATGSCSLWNTGLLTEGRNLLAVALQPKHQSHPQFPGSCGKHFYLFIQGSPVYIRHGFLIKTSLLTDISPRKTYRWPTGTWKDAQCHQLLEKCKSKPQRSITSHESKWLSLKSTNEKCWMGCGEKGTLLHCWCSHCGE